MNELFARNFPRDFFLPLPLGEGVSQQPALDRVSLFVGLHARLGLYYYLVYIGLYYYLVSRGII